MTIKNGHQSGVVALRDQLVAEHLERALAQAAHWAGRYPHLREDFEEAALMALERATRGDFQGRSNFTTYLYAAVQNHIRMAIRTHRRKPITGANELLDTIPNQGKDVAEDGSNRLARMWTLLERIAQPRDREILWLRDGLDLPIEEIARILNIGLSTAKSKLRRARSLACSCARILFPETTSWATRDRDADLL